MKNLLKHYPLFQSSAVRRGPLREVSKSHQLPHPGGAGRDRLIAKTHKNTQTYRQTLITHKPRHTLKNTNLDIYTEEKIKKKISSHTLNTHKKKQKT